MFTSDKIQLRKEFLTACSLDTQAIHEPILDTNLVQGRLNPAGLGNAIKFSGIPGGQSVVVFDKIEDYKKASKNGRSPYSGAEYGVVQTPEAARVCAQFAQLHGGNGAVILPSGLSAIKTVLDTFLKVPNGRQPAILIPDNRYSPTERALNEMKKFMPGLYIGRYPGNATGAEVDALIRSAKQDNGGIDLLYLEAPGSQTFEIPELHEIVKVAQSHGIRIAMDNTWATHARFKPLIHGIDVAIQATTKYEGGYGDTPSGVVIARTVDDFEALAWTVRVSGTGAVSPETCNRLFGRVASTTERMDHHYKSAKKIIEWMKRQDFTSQVLCPYIPSSPDHVRFKDVFNKGNGLFSLVFRDDIPKQQIGQFLDSLNLFRIGESWGAHVSLVLPAKPERSLSQLPAGKMVRFSVGLEDPDDLIRDLNEAAPQLGLY